MDKIIFQIVEWTLTFLSIAGVVLNIRYDRRGFILWMFSNAGWMCIDYVHGLYAQALLFGVYLILSLWGWITWEK